MLHKEKRVEVNSRVGSTGKIIQTTPAVKSADSTGMEIVVMLVKGFSDLLMGDKAG